MNIQTFSDLSLLDVIKNNLEKENYKEPTPIQKLAIPHLLLGKDLLGCAQTGTGKTAAFALPMLQNLSKSGNVPSSKRVRALILTPTRELAIQILESFRTYGQGLNLTSMTVFGGVNQNPQARTLQKGVDILVATPGRLLDLLNQRLIFLDKVEIFVLDEADRMLDMGFIRDIKKILPLLPQKRQNLFFSATMPDEIEKLASSILVNPVKVEAQARSSTVERIKQSVMFVPRGQKVALLIHLLKDESITRVLVFCKTKHGANKISERLQKAGITCDAIHGNKSQSARVKALEGFREGHVRVLVATDIAARGIDIDDISHVINYELPNVPESYVHRIGRTARAGEGGDAISFCDGEERSFLRGIERLIKKELQVVINHTFDPKLASDDHLPRTERSRPHGGSRSHSGSGSGGGGGRSQNSPRAAQSGPGSYNRPRVQNGLSSQISPRNHSSAPRAHTGPRDHSARTPHSGGHRPAAPHRSGSAPQPRPDADGNTQGRPQPGGGTRRRFFSRNIQPQEN